MKNKLFFLLFFLCAISSYAQKQANIWYFGDNAGVNFNSGSPVALLNGQMSILEGCASIADYNGNLLFYTDGNKIWNRNHAVMQNGTGLMGDNSSTQSAVIVPHPSDQNIYYVFTVDACQNGLANGIRYSKVDMTLASGMGAVVTTEKNILLVSPVAEKISAVMHYDQQSIWVITHGYGNNTFYVFKIDEDGVNLTPQTYNLGSVHYGTDGNDQCGDLGNSRGYIKASPDGSKLALAIGRSEIFELFDFDTQTGVVSNPVTFNGYSRPYGVEFSPNGSKLYIAIMPEMGGSSIYQVNMSNLNQVNLVHQSNNITFGALQVATNDKIYATQVGENYLAVINNPDNNYSSVGFATNAVNLSRTAQYGLPTFIQSFFLNPGFTVQNICYKDITQFTINSTVGIDSVIWNFGNPASGVANTSKLFNPTHIFTAPGQYEISLTAYSQEIAAVSKQVIVIRRPNCTLNDDVQYCATGVLATQAGYSSYLWSTGATTNSISVNTTGTYWVRVTDQYGCVNSDTSDVVINPLPTILSEDVFTGCYNVNNVAVTIHAKGGTGSYLFQVNSIAYQTDSLFANLPHGNLTLKVKDAKNCLATKNITVANPPAVTLALSKTDVTCFGHETGQITSTAGGGVQPYNYLWSNGAITNTISNLAAGKYILNLTDNNNCLKKDSVIILQPTEIIIEDTLVGVSCKTWSDAWLQIAATGGMPSYTYLWNTGATTPELNDIPAGTYTVDVTDTYNCTVSKEIEVTEASFALKISQAHIKDVLCYSDASGFINLTLSGGEQPYIVEWSNGIFAEDITDLEKDTYYVIVEDNRGCVIDSAFTVNEPVAPLQAWMEAANVKCKDGFDAHIDLSVSGGTAPYRYNWSNSLQTEDLQNLTAGFYSVTVLDTNDCSVIDTITILEPKTALVMENEHNHIYCKGGNNGFINLNVSGGVPFYNFLWSNGAVTEDINQLTAGDYSVLLTDKNGCEITQTISIEEPQHSLVFNNVDVNHILCHENNTGAITLEVNGGVTPYEIRWSNNETTENIQNLFSGIYTITVTDSSLCTIDTTLVVEQPAAALNLQIQKTDVACRGDASGAVNLTINGGTASYNTIWSNGHTAEDLNFVYAGKYLVAVTDANGCTKNDSVFIEEPDEFLFFSHQKQDVNCKFGNDGFIEIDVWGGSPQYSYQWSNGATTHLQSNLTAGNYTVIISDAEGCNKFLSVNINEPAFPLHFSDADVNNLLCNGIDNGEIDVQVGGGTFPYTYLWSNNQNTPSVENLSANIYSLNVTDVNGCDIDTSFTLTEPPTAISAILEPVNADCNMANNGLINLTVTGGTPNYTFLWSNGAQTEDVANLTPAEYSVTITDENGCQLTKSTIVNNSVVLTIYETPISCYGLTNGFLNLSVLGGTPMYSYSWSNGATTEDIGNLSQGVYSVTVTDADGCVVSKSAMVTQPAMPLTLAMEKQNVSCFNGTNGLVNITPQGGTSPYSYIWSNNMTTQDAQNVKAGFYAVLVTDSRGCTADTMATLTQPSTPISVSYQKTDVLCYGNASGAIQLNVSGGVPQYSYLWSHNSQTEDQFNLLAGKYIFNVTDANNCVYTDSVFINQPLQDFVVTVDDENISCFGAGDGSIELNVSGGTPNYSFLWNTGATTQNIFQLEAGLYSVVVTDNVQCQEQQFILIDEPFKIEPLFEVTNVDCFGNATGAVNLTVNGGTPEFQYFWSNNTTTQNLENLLAGEYHLQIIDANLCSFIDTVFVQQPLLPLTTSVEVSPVVCYAGYDGAIDLTITGGTPQYSFLWNTGQTTEDINALIEGLYSVDITDANNCSTATSVFIDQPDYALDVIVEYTNINCNAANNGTINLTVSGGRQPYSFAWSNGAETEDLFNLAAGQYTVVVSDSLGCAVQKQIFISEPLAIETFFDITNVDCFNNTNGAIDLTVSGGAAGYSYLWSNNSLEQDLTNLRSGRYIVTVTDANNCTKNDTALVTQPQAALSLLPTVIDVQCYGLSNGSINLEVSGGTPQYAFNWSHGANTEDLINLPIGEYHVTVTDANNCIEETSVTVHQPEIFILQSEVSNVKCFGGSDGFIALSVFGGIPNYTFEWSTGANSQSIANITAGTYWVTATDNNLCEIHDTIVITEALEIVVDYVTDFSCNGANDGVIDITVTGGAQPYNYQWSNDRDMEDIFGLQPGLYTVTITDGNNCKQDKEINLQEPEVLYYETVITPASCNLVPNGEVLFNTFGGTPPYYYVWQEATLESPLITGVQAGIYRVFLTDSKNCSFSTYFEVPIVYENCVGLTNAFTPNGDGFNDTWIIEGIELFPEAEIRIYDRYGNMVDFYTPNDAPWDGYNDGELLPVDTYYYVIELNFGFQPALVGSVTLIR